MGRGQLKYRKRGGRGHGGPSSGGRGQAGRGGTGSGNSTAVADAAPGRVTKAKRRGGGQHSTAHLPSNTEKWGLSFDEDSQHQQGRRTGPASSSAVSFEETQRLLDESEWATGASSWRLGATTEAPDEQPVEAAAAASGELLSLNLDILEKCLRRSSVHDRLRLPHTYTAELEDDFREDPALEPDPARAALSPTTTRKRGGSEGAGAAGVGGGGGRDAGEHAATAAGAPANAREGGARVGDGDGGGGGGGGGGGDEDGVLDALLDLPAAGDSSRAGEPGPTTSSAGRAALKPPSPPTSLPPGHDAVREGGGMPTEPAIGVGRPGTGAGVGGGVGGGGGGGGGDADELEDWLDDMLADA